MPAVPRIVREVPKGNVTRPEQGIEVIARLRWHHGPLQLVLVTAVAWTQNAVEIQWEMDAGDKPRTDWIPADDVWRPGGTPKPDLLPLLTGAVQPKHGGDAPARQPRSDSLSPSSSDGDDPGQGH
jgi:hypothetical protein